MLRTSWNKLSIEQINDKRPVNCRLTAKEYAPTRVTKGGYKITYIICLCSCGKSTMTTVSRILSGHTRSCGCALKGCQIGMHTKYSHTIPKLRSVHTGMMHRCYNTRDNSYNTYGGRGVSVCDEWHNYQNFLDWALVNGWKPGLQLDKDIKGNGLLYSPETCCFVDRITNCNNRRLTLKYKYKGELLSISEICRKYNIDYSGVRNRMLSGMTLLKAIRATKNVMVPVNIQFLLLDWGKIKLIISKHYKMNVHDVHRSHFRKYIDEMAIKLFDRNILKTKKVFSRYDK